MESSQLLLQPGALPSRGAARPRGRLGTQAWTESWQQEEKGPRLKLQKEQENGKLGQVNGKLRDKATAGQKTKGETASRGHRQSIPGGEG